MTVHILNRFDRRFDENQISLQRAPFEILQVNVGKLCNQTCRHCHVTAGPNRKEIMTAKVAERCLELLDEADSWTTLDITGGAPELTPVFRDLVLGGHRRGLRVIDRCNLTVLTEPGQEDLADFLADHDVDIVASLPCYTAGNVDKQRGEGVFDRSIAALRLLNERGYGTSGDRRRLDLVYNPGGPSLPPPQENLERDYKVRLREDFGVEFSSLITIANMPIGRFATDLKSSGKLENYMEKLEAAFNPATVPYLMCRTHLSVDWQGYVFDCDFNQMLELPLGGEGRPSIMETPLSELQKRHIATGDHCLGCTAGSGSSCGGSLV